MNPTTRSVRIQPRPEKAPEKRTRRQIVGGWFKEETFYRDIATRALAAALVAVVAYLGAVALGYIGTPTATTMLGAVIAALTTGFFALAVIEGNKGRYVRSVFFGMLMPFVLTIGIRLAPKSVETWMNTHPLPRKWVLLIVALQFIVTGKILVSVSRREAQRRSQRDRGATPTGSATDAPGDSARRPWMSVRMPDESR